MLALDDDALRVAISRINPNPARRARYLLHDVLRRNARALAAIEAQWPLLRFAYSVKTNPNRGLLEIFREAGLYAEVISPGELALARGIGFDQRIIYNGPFPAWRTRDMAGVVFSDSTEAFAENVRTLEAALVGIRIRPPGIRSRFGIAESQLGEVCDVIRASAVRTTAVSLHVRPEDFAGRSWRTVMSSVIELARHIETKTGAKIRAFDVGGGRTPVEFDQSLAAGDFVWLLRETQAALPNASTIFAEPGQAIVTPGVFVVAPVLEVRRGVGGSDLVIDAGYPDLPQMREFNHRVLAIVDGEPVLLGPGPDRVLGCTCLEYDVIRDDVRLPGRLDRVQAIAIADAGAYDHSMGFDFARGGNRAVDDQIGVPEG